MFHVALQPASNVNTTAENSETGTRTKVDGAQQELRRKTIETRSMPLNAEVDEILVLCHEDFLNLRSVQAINFSGKNVLGKPSSVRRIQMHPAEWGTELQVLTDWNDTNRILQADARCNIHTTMADSLGAIISYQFKRPIFLTEVIVENRHWSYTHRITSGGGGEVELRRCGQRVWTSRRMTEDKAFYRFKISPNDFSHLPDLFFYMPRSEYHGLLQGEFVYEGLDALDAPITVVRVYFCEENGKRAVAGFEISRRNKPPSRFGGTSTDSIEKTLAAGDRLVQVTCGYESRNSKINSMQFRIARADGTVDLLFNGDDNPDGFSAVFEPPEDKTKVIGFFGRHTSHDLYGLGVFYG
ncbi:hypothetical protein HDU96_009527 [Phlyctochytrium bullatum]|nr:hypothetical protein HDU96_009527 [Phlyctochytrium bullatum]